MSRTGVPSMGFDLLKLLPRQSWRDQAVCATHPMPWLWDAVTDDKESREDRDYRHDTAKAICRGCPVRDRCWADVDHELDEGVRGGRVLHERPERTHRRAS